MTKPISKKHLACALLACFFLSTPAMAKKMPVPDMSKCSKKMLANPRLATDECLTAQVDDLKIKVENRYNQINSHLPPASAPATDTEYETLSQDRINDLASNFKTYQDKACSVQAASYGLQKRGEDKEYAICMIDGLKQHLNYLKHF
jgi:hypothetical protein